MIDVEVTNCCGCFGLRKGVIIISILRLIIECLVFIPFLIVLNGNNDVFEKANNESKAVWDYINSVATKILIPYFIFFVALEIILLVGVFKVKPNLILLHQVIIGSFLVVDFFCVFICAIAFPAILTNLLGMVIPIYFWIVIHSYYKSLINEGTARGTFMVVPNEVPANMPLGAERV